MTSVQINRGYRETFSVLLLNTVVSDMRIRVTPRSGEPLRIGLVAGALGQVLALASETDARGTHTRCTVTLPPAATRALGEGAVNEAEMESLPLQEHLGAFVIEGSIGLNDD